MCGIIGYVGKRDAVPVLLDGLKMLEYRGYDSSGVAVHNGANLTVVKRAGRLSVLEAALSARAVKGCCGIGHTRWATHGVATDQNAHPFVSSYGKFAVVHNGIVSNYLHVADFLRERGVRFCSDTDSEVIAHLIDFYYTGDVLSALCRAVKEVKGSFALGVISVYEPHVVYGVRKDSPLVVGEGEKEFALCSDVSAISGFCHRFCALQNGEIVRLSEEKAELFDFEGNPLPLRFEKREKEEFDDREPGVDDMLAEIRQIPASLLLGYEKFPKGKVRACLKKDIKDILVLGCGSAYHAGLVFAEAMREIAGVCVRTEIASEFLTENCCVSKDTLVIAVSQSGETADTLLAVDRAKNCGATVLSVCNARASSLVRASDCFLITRCGREKAVAATKSYVSQVQYLLLLCLEYADIKGKTKKSRLADLRREVACLPQKAEEILRVENDLKKVALDIKNAEAVFFLGRKGDYSAAKEGSLKLKEVSYLFSEAYPSGELKHGTLALMERGVYGVVIATDPALLLKNAMTVSEITCRGASSVVIASASFAGEIKADHVVAIPDTNPVVSPILSAVVMQYFAYFAAKARGCDVDRPRNLAKSVTVE